jgi:predicted SnoaL-like aldol condensation-catalyzing enzyme
MTAPVIDASTPAERDNVQRVLDCYSTVVDKRDASSVGRFVADDFVQHNPFYGTGQDGLERFLSGPLLTIFPDLTTEVELVIAQQDRDRADYTSVKRLYGYHPKQIITGGR